MIYFVSDRKHKVQETENLQTIPPELFRDRLFSAEIKGDLIGLDTETNGLDPYKNQVLLVIYGDAENQFVIDWTCTELIIELLSDDKTWLGHNLKFDYKMLRISYNIKLKKMYDVMIAEQRIYQGFDHSNSLAAITTRKLGILPEGMDKNIRMDFVGKDPETFQFENKHVVYAANDIMPLFQIKEKQEVLIEKANQRFLLYDIEFPLIAVLAEAELEGWYINKKKWKELIEKNKKLKFEYESKLDEELRRLRKFLPKEQLQYLSNGKYDRSRSVKVEIESLDLFGEVTSPKKVKQEAFINYGSATELVYILGRLGAEVPTKDGFYNVPKFITNSKGKQVIDKTSGSYTIGAGAIENYIAENPTTKIRSFIEMLVKFREASTRINTFGEGFLLKFINPVTGKAHTIFRQSFAITGRLQSGNKDEGYFNSQNIPAEKDYRECFYTDKDYEVTSCDYSGCEAVVMIDKAKDEKFYEIAIKNDDAHSPIAQNVWREIGKYRLETGININADFKDDDSGTIITKTPLELSRIVVSKKENKFIRTGYKNNTFAVCYGCGIKKYSKTLRISNDEGKIGIRVQKAMFPKTFRYLDSVAKQAITNGYVVINTRTNSRVWYPKVIEARKGGWDLSFQDQHEIESSARNITIQGTNADIVKEAMVELTNQFEEMNLDAKVIGSVHDEIIVKHHKSIKSITCIVNNDTQILSMGEFIKHIMEEVANKYLSFINMKAEYKTLTTWTK